MEKQIAQEPTAAAWSDLSAAILSELDGPDDWRTLDSALLAVETALEKEPGYSRALFNRALILEKLSLDELALEAWTAYVDSGEGGLWTEEAESRLELIQARETPDDRATLVDLVGTLDDLGLRQLALERPSAIQRLLDSDTALYRSIATDIRSFCAGPSERWLKLGEEVETAFSDALLKDSVRWICGPPPYDDTAAAISLLADAIDHYWRSETEEALAAAERAETLLDARDPLATIEMTDRPIVHIAAIVRGMAMFARDRHDDAIAVLRATEKQAASTYPILAARARRYLGSIEIRRRNSGDAEHHFRIGLDLLGEHRDPEQRVRLNALAAESLSLAGRVDDAWRRGLDALREARELALSADTLSAACEFLAIVAAESGTPQLQELYADCSIRHLDTGGDPALVTSAHAARAQARIALGDYEGAAQDIMEATAATAGIADDAERANLTHYLDLLAGVHPAADVNISSLERVTDALNHFKRTGHRGYEIAASTALGYAYATSGDTEKADYYFDYVGRLAVEAQQSAESPRFSLPIQQHYRHVANHRIRTRLAAGDAEGALRVLTEARLARTISDPEFGNIVSEVSIRGNGDPTLVLAWLDDDVAGWLIRDAGIQDWFVSPLRKGRRLVGRAAGTDSTPLPEGRAGALRALYEALIAPVESTLAESDTLRIVPDGLLFGVPYPALWNADTNRFLIEERPIIVVPELLVRRRVNESQMGFPAVAVFADPKGDPNRPLHLVDDEADYIRKSFETTSTVDLYLGQTATPATFLDALGRYDLVHFAGHGDVNLKSPLDSKLVLGSEDRNGKSAVTAADLYALRAPSMPRLVVLAACDTAAYTERFPHALAVVRPLLDLGTEEVIGSLRPIPDAQYLQMMERFYDVLRRTDDAAMALRIVQIDFARSNDPAQPGHWAAMQIYRYL